MKKEKAGRKRKEKYMRVRVGKKEIAGGRKRKQGGKQKKSI